MQYNNKEIIIWGNKNMAKQNFFTLINEYGIFFLVL